ncbi:hypothetical protein GMA1_6 [Gordonia phage GMA1]|uniref:major head protein n=1 Tax=Gordonia phage GMA1 TaxID=1647470 RepID=UPI0007B623EE|nr:major head protein [Gordonia phage GMA1]AKJ72103.1 hypothetical protein GMA1_6 [Gordonia phage GMA1]
MAPITLAEAKKNTQEDYDPFVIDEFRKVSALLDGMIFDDAVNPAGGGATLTYGYRRLVDQANAAFRALNSEYTDQAVTTVQKSVNLAVLGGSFSIDRVVAKLGPAASGQIALHIAQLAKAASAKFQDALINGDTATDANGFDGLSKALTGSATEITSTADWSDFDTNPRAEHKALDVIDEFLMSLDGAPTFLVANKAALARVRAAVRRSGQYVKDPVEGLVGPSGRPVERETYGGITLIDAGEKPGSSAPVIPVDGTTKKTDIYAIRVGLDGFHAVTTVGSQVIQTWLPDFSTSGAVKRGEVELGPVGCALKATKAAAVLRGVKVA